MFTEKIHNLHTDDDFKKSKRWRLNKNKINPGDSYDLWNQFPILPYNNIEKKNSIFYPLDVFFLKFQAALKTNNVIFGVLRHRL